MMPALLTSTFRRGLVCLTVCRSNARPASVATSHAMVCRAGNAAFASASLASLRPQTMTELLRARRALASSSPMPDEPPVMRTVFPLVRIGVPAA